MRAISGRETNPKGESALRFESILFDHPEDRYGLDQVEAPPFFGDLNLDQVVDSITEGRDAYNLKPFFFAPLHRVDSVNYRQEVFRDLEREDVLDCVASFAQRMRSMREQLAQAAKLRYKYQKESWFVDAVGMYCEAVKDLTRDLELVELRSRALLRLRDYLASYTRSAEFTSLVAETEKVKQLMAGVTYSLRIHGNRITVSRYDSKPDYAADVIGTFQKFQRGDVKDYRTKFKEYADMNHIEEGVLYRVVLLYPTEFGALDSYCTRHRGYLDKVIGDFDREVQFYVAYLQFIRQFSGKDLKFCYPVVSEESKEVCATDTFDLALANRLSNDRSRVVCNDFGLKDPERLIVITGPNQGGKTTFARTFGQLHHLAALGCLVPGKEAHLFLFDKMFTQFERGENLTDLRGKLQDDLVRMHQILKEATTRSILILNEVFTSTTVDDALFLSKKILERVIQLDLLCICVTFIDELAFLGPSTVSMMSTVTPEDPTVRTFKVIRKPADGRAYAVAIANKYHLGYEMLKERLTQ